MKSVAKLQLFCEKRLLYQKNVVILHPQIGKNRCAYRKIRFIQPMWLALMKAVGVDWMSFKNNSSNIFNYVS